MIDVSVAVGTKIGGNSPEEAVSFQFKLPELKNSQPLRVTGGLDL